MNKYFLPLALTALTACDNNQSTPDNPFNNLKDAFVNFDKDVGVTDARLGPDMDSQADISVSDTSVVDLSRDRALPDTGSDEFGPSRELSQIHFFEEQASPSTDFRPSRLRNLEGDFLLATNIQGQGGRLIKFDHNEILFDRTASVDPFTTFRDVTLFQEAYLAVGDTGPRTEKNQLFARFSLQGELDRIDLLPTPSDDSLVSIVTTNGINYAAGSSNDQAQICVGSSCEELELGRANDYKLLDWLGHFAVGKTPQGAKVWYRTLQGDRTASTLIGGESSELYALDFSGSMCVVGQMWDDQHGSQAYFAFVDLASSQTEQQFTPFTGVFYDVIATQQGCVAVGEHRIRQSQPGGEGGLSQAIAVAFDETGPLWHASTDVDSGFNLFSSIATSPQGYVLSARVSQGCSAGLPCHDAIYTLEIEQ